MESTRTVVVRATHNAQPAGTGILLSAGLAKRDYDLGASKVSVSRVLSHGRHCLYRSRPPPALLPVSLT